LSGLINPNNEFEELFIIPSLGFSVSNTGSLNCALIETDNSTNIVKRYFFIIFSKSSLRFYANPYLMSMNVDVL
jgi:hypothetical protein